MKAHVIFSDGSSCRSPSVRVRRPDSWTKHLQWLHIRVLVVLLAGQASCDQTSTTLFTLSATTKAQPSVYYFVDITVAANEKKNESEIVAWLMQVFQNNLESCIPPNLDKTTAQPTSSQTTSTTTPQINNTTAAVSLTTFERNNTTTAAISTTFESNNTTTASTSTTFERNNTTASTSTTFERNNTATASTSTTFESNNTTTALTSTTFERNNTTTASTSTTFERNNTTTASTSTTFERNNTTTASTSTTFESNNTTTALPSTTFERNNTTTATISTAFESNNTTTVATSTMFENNNTTTAATSTVLKSNSATTAATSTLLESSKRTTAATSPALQSNERTTPATSTVLQSNERTTAVTSTTLKSNKRTTAVTSTALQSNERTTPATSTALQSNERTTPATSTVLQSNERTTAVTSTTLKSNKRTTAVTSTALQSNERTTPATSTTLKSNKRTTAVTSPALQSNERTTPATSTALHRNERTTPATSTALHRNERTSPASSTALKSSQFFSISSNQRIARELHNNETRTSGVGNDNTTGLFQGIEVNCMETAMKNNNCVVMLKLKQSIPSCCILRTLCTANKNSSDIQVVGKRADRTTQLQDECYNNLHEEDSCIYNGHAGASCEESGSAYVVYQSNSTNCGAGNNSCNCSAYCNRTDAHYTFELSINSPKINVSYVLSLISKMKETNCSQSTDVPCSSSIISSQYKDAHVTCGSTATNLQSCRVILGFASEVPICNVSAAVMDVLQFEKQISYSGLMTRAAICGNSGISNNPLDSQFTWVQMKLKPDTFCMTIQDSPIQNCQNGKNVVIQLEEQCIQEPFTTPIPYVTSTQPNTTTSSVNVTSSPPSTTAEALNATSTASYTVTETINTTTATTNGSVFVTTESPATTDSADSQANTLLALARNVSSLNSSQVDLLVSQLENLLSGPNVSLALGNTSIHIVSSLLDASPETLSKSSNRIIGIVDTVALKLVLAEQPETLLSPAVALSVKPADGSNFQESFFSISNPSSVQVRGDPRLKRNVRSDSSIAQGSIRLPPSLTQNLTSEEQQLASRVQFNFYQKSTVFQDKSLGVRKLNSGILGASVANLSITGLQDDVVIYLKNIEPVPANFVSKCVFWDFTLNDGSGGWNSSGCSVKNSTVTETFCSCNHLTSFAILLDLSREPLTSRLQATILTFITYIGCGISAIFLSVTLLTYLAFGKLRKDIPSKILIQLCLALLLLNLVFLVDAWLALYPDAMGLCISTAWFLHYFLLVSFTWMGLEAVHMYLALVKVFNSYISRYMLKFSLVGWGVPMIVVIIVIAIDKNNYGLVSYGKFTDGTSDDFCWLKNDIAFYVAVVAYFCVIFIFNLIMFAVVLVQLCRIKRQNPHNALHRTTLQDARSVLGITFLLGLTWGFAFFAWGPVNLPFMYLFAIFNSLQGFFMFIFHCAVKENVRRQWRTYLCCGRMRLAENSEWSRTATQKTAKKSSVTRLTSLQSSKSNNSSGSSSYLVSDSSDQNNGIGSPFEDRTITADEDHSADVILNEINRQYRNQ